jgi:hypothetical protein
MTWLTTPPPSRPRPPRYPLFTTKVFSTKSFGPGHLVGAGILVVGIGTITKLLIARAPGRADGARPRGASGPGGAPALAQVTRSRGQYGSRP